VTRAAVSAPAPTPVGLAPSFGFGDRLGLATPGHIAGLRRAGSQVVPVLAQQSARELERTRRTFGDVLTAAAAGAQAAGWAGPFGADADHLKTDADVAAAAAAGFTTFTLDPSDAIAAIPSDRLRAAFEALDPAILETTPADLLARYRGGVELANFRLVPDDAEVARAAVTYAGAIALVVRLAAGVPAGCDLEVSVDETDTETTPFDHAFVALELARRGVRPTSLAPRFPGRFEKAVDFQGDRGRFERTVRAHADVAQALGPYKLSLHSGSDKLAVYRAFAEATDGALHVKTSGTWYLEALRVLAAADPPLLREIWRVGRRDFEQARRSYEISAELAAAPPEDLPDAELPRLLDDDVSRQILHVTYGSVLGDHAVRDRVLAALTADGGAAYSEAVAARVAAHLEALAL